MAKKLVRRYENFEIGSFEEFYLFMAGSIEDSLIASGATPGKDYTLVDLYKLAQPFAMDYFKEHGLPSVNMLKSESV